MTVMRFREAVRAAMVADPGGYRWSSYRANGLGQTDARLTPHALYLALDAEPASRCAAYRALFRPQLDADAASEVREALRLGMPLGNERFAQAICAQLGERTTLHGIKQSLLRWYWSGVLGELYGGALETRIANDVDDLLQWILHNGPEPRTVQDATFNPDRLDRLTSRLSAACFRRRSTRRRPTRSATSTTSPTRPARSRSGTPSATASDSADRTSR